MPQRHNEDVAPIITQMNAIGKEFQNKHEQEKEKPLTAGISEPYSLKTNLGFHYQVCSASQGDFKSLVGYAIFSYFSDVCFSLCCEKVEDFVSTFNGYMVVPLYDNIQILDNHSLWGEG